MGGGSTIVRIIQFDFKIFFKVEDEVERDADYVAGDTKALMILMTMVMMMMRRMVILIFHNTGKTGMPASVVIGLFLLVSFKKLHDFVSCKQILFVTVLLEIQVLYIFLHW